MLDLGIFELELEITIVITEMNVPEFVELQNFVQELKNRIWDQKCLI